MARRNEGGRPVAQGFPPEPVWAPRLRPPRDCPGFPPASSPVSAQGPDWFRLLQGHRCPKASPPPPKAPLLGPAAAAVPRDPRSAFRPRLQRSGACKGGPFGAKQARPKGVLRGRKASPSGPLRRPRPAPLPRRPELPTLAFAQPAQAPLAAPGLAGGSRRAGPEGKKPQASIQPRRSPAGTPPSPREGSALCRLPGETSPRKRRPLWRRGA